MILLFIIIAFPMRIPALQYTEKWGYITVRPKAHMFWWLYKVTNGHRPLVIWLQGGPGDSGTGYGNFEEIGPLDLNSEFRNTTWLTKADLLFVDCPVGSGFSYVEFENEFSRALNEIMDDLMNFTHAWFNDHPDYRSKPIFVFGESYGGKMAIAYVWEMHKRIQNGQLKIDLKGVGLGNSWISPVDFMMSWPDFLYYHSWISPLQLDQIRLKTEECLNFTLIDHWSNATECIQQLARIVNKMTSGVSWYNILKHDKSDAFSKTGDSFSDQLEKKMNTDIRDKISVIPDHVHWGSQSNQVYLALYNEIMHSAVPIVDRVLKNTNLHVVIYNGQLDLICNTPGVQTWMKKLTWSKMNNFYAADRMHIPHEISNNQELFMQRFDRLWFFWILHAGHNVPADAGETSLKILDAVFTDLLIKEGLRSN